MRWPDDDLRGPTPSERVETAVRRLFWRARIDLLTSEYWGFDAGAWACEWRKFGPFLAWLEMGNPNEEHDDGGWRLALLLSPQAVDGFLEGASK